MRKLFLPDRTVDRSLIIREDGSAIYYPLFLLRRGYLLETPSQVARVRVFLKRWHTLLAVSSGALVFALIRIRRTSPELIPAGFVFLPIIVGVGIFIAVEVKITHYARQEGWRRLPFRESILNFAPKERTARVSLLLAAMLFPVVVGARQTIESRSLLGRIIRASITLSIAFPAGLIAVALGTSLFRNDSQAFRAQEQRRFGRPKPADAPPKVEG
jgi:hypothetical protein